MCPNSFKTLANVKTTLQKLAKDFWNFAKVAKSGHAAYELKNVSVQSRVFIRLASGWFFLFLCGKKFEAFLTCQDQSLRVFCVIWQLRKLKVIGFPYKIFLALQTLKDLWRHLGTTLAVDVITLFWRKSTFPQNWEIQKVCSGDSTWSKIALAQFSKSFIFLNTNITITVTRLDDFWTFLAINCLSKVAGMFVDFWGILSKNCLGLFLGQL